MQMTKLFLIPFCLLCTCSSEVWAQNVVPDRSDWIIGSLAVVINPANTIFLKGERVKVAGASGNTVDVVKNETKGRQQPDRIAAENLQPLAFKLISSVDDSREMLVYSVDDEKWVSPPAKDGRTNLEFVAPGEWKPHSAILRPNKSMVWPVPKSGRYRLFYMKSNGRLVELRSRTIPTNDNYEVDVVLGRDSLPEA